MQPYSDSEIDDALERVAGDIARRRGQPEFSGISLVAVVDQLRAMESARRGGDLVNAARIALTAGSAFDTYRPTNATSRAKAVLVEVLAHVLEAAGPPSADDGA